MNQSEIKFYETESDYRQICQIFGVQLSPHSSLFESDFRSMYSLFELTAVLSELQRGPPHWPDLAVSDTPPALHHSFHHHQIAENGVLHQ